MGSLALEILVPQTEVLARKYGVPIEKSIQVEGVGFRPSLSSRRI